jgi:hypothetical protein
MLDGIRRLLRGKDLWVLMGAVSSGLALAGGLLWSLHYAGTRKAPAPPPALAEMACEPQTSPGYHGYIMRCVTPAGQRVEFRDVEWERRTKNLPGPMD